LSCPKCGRSGQYRKQTLIERFGPDIRLPDLREELAQCERRGPTIYGQFTCDDGARLFDWVRAQAVFFLLGFRRRNILHLCTQGPARGPFFIRVPVHSSVSSATQADPSRQGRWQIVGVRREVELL